ncbi:hypothetical protein YTPLAS18_14380 [Nitrospira sp.]|nr:hypothetical protein YTPLAS18_14380 [Nitrospira sp.]
MVSDGTIAEQLRASNNEYRQLEEAHHRLDAELAELQRRHVLTPAEELLKKQLQKEKLSKKDQMADMIRRHREGEVGATAR